MILNQIYLIASVVIGVAIALWFFKRGLKNLKMLLTFSGAYLLGIGIFHLLPEVYVGHNHYYGLFIIAGFFVQLILEAFSKGLEHGHAHTELFKNKGLPLGVVLSLFLHAFLESIPIGGHQHEFSQNALLLGLIVHKIPVTIILFTMLKEVTQNLWKLTFWMALFALMAPLGILIGNQVAFLADYGSEMLAFVFGIFLHISTTILFESNESHRFNLMKLSVIIVALALAWLSVVH